MMTIELGRIVVNASGDERPVHSEKFIPERVEENTIVFPDKKEIVIDWRRNFEHLKRASALREEAELVQEEATVNVSLDNPELPALIWLPSDMHIGCDTTNHELLEEHINTVIETDNAFAVTVGDDIDNGLWGSMPYTQALPVYMQSFTVKNLAEELGGNNERQRELVLARCTGNHTDWTFSAAGHSWEDIWYGNTKAPVFPNMGMLHLNVGEQTYDVALAHKYWGMSKLNPTNACKRLLEHEYPEADLIVIGHNHVTETLKFTRGGKERVAIRSGTYKTKDWWARRHGIALRGQRGGVCVLLYPDKRKMLPFTRLEDGVEYLKILQELDKFK